MSKVLLVGYGYMGRAYAKNLRALGIAEEDIVVTDVDPARLEEFRRDYPRATAAEDVTAALESRPAAAFVLTTTSSHVPVLSRLARATSIKGILVEKPLSLSGEDALVDLIPGLERHVLAVGYLIHFSPAVAFLSEMMTSRGLVVIEASGTWTKNRTADGRPTVGDLEDEFTHLFGVFLRLLSVGRHIDFVRLSAAVSRPDFVDAAAQAAVKARDPSVDLVPVGSTYCIGGAHASPSESDVGPGVVPFGLLSSFVASRQERRLCLRLGDASGPAMIAELTFDGAGGRDTLELVPWGTNAPHDAFQWDGSSKLRDQIAAFLAATGGNPRDHRLVGRSFAKTMARVSEAVLRCETSGESQTVIVDGPIN